MKNTLWHAGESNPEAKVDLAAYDIANLSCRVRVRCHNVARGKIIITYNRRGERWSRTTIGGKERSENKRQHNRCSPFPRGIIATWRGEAFKWRNEKKRVGRAAGGN